MADRIKEITIELGNASLVMEEYQVVLDKPMFREK